MTHQCCGGVRYSRDESQTIVSIAPEAKLNTATFRPISPFLASAFPVGARLFERSDKNFPEVMMLGTGLAMR